MILEQCKGVHFVDFDESFQTHIYLQSLASIQPRTSLVKFARSPRTDPPGDLVRKERHFKTAVDKSVPDWQTEGIRFVLRGCLHSGWNVGVLIYAPGFFDEEKFFSLHFASTTAAPELYATEYTEVLLIAREVAIRTFVKYPLQYNDYVQEIIGMRWYTFTKALLTRLNSKHLLNSYVRQGTAKHSTQSTPEPEPPSYATNRIPGRVEMTDLPWTAADVSPRLTRVSDVM